MTAIPASYDVPGSFPFTVDVADPQPQNRLSVLLRILYVIPALIVVSIVGIIAEIITIIAWFAIVISGKYPAGMMNFAVGTARWSTRVRGYMLLLTDKYPPFSLEDDAAYPIRFQGEGQVDGRNRVTTFFRIFMVIPHIIVMYFLNLAGSAVSVISWLIALFTGSVPPGLHTFLAGVLRWETRVGAYMLLLTDEYPPFALT